MTGNNSLEKAVPPPSFCKGGDGTGSMRVISGGNHNLIDDALLPYLAMLAFSRILFSSPVTALCALRDRKRCSLNAGGGGGGVRKVYALRCCYIAGKGWPRGDEASLPPGRISLNKTEVKMRLWIVVGIDGRSCLPIRPFDPAFLGQLAP
ncbi:hypothetical protein LX32DRAFT_277397 [Colletotrichum zoysiae]|uniref:Uncharacterized protein n=1 Tax=Colletotrichum zoysiae TaxID=1216348 RepID=A0AAD9H3E9_9PEZI|nr:hypothetical protein LX32DRAFT_277397 [Colletotrichum zoysiae]